MYFDQREIMGKLSNDLPTRSNDTVEQDLFQKPTTDKPVERPLSNEEANWQSRILENMKRMTTDEAFRLEIAKKLS